MIHTLILFFLDMLSRSLNLNPYEKFLNFLRVMAVMHKLSKLNFLLFCDNRDSDKTWSSIGYGDLNHFGRSARKHEKSGTHLTFAVIQNIRNCVYCNSD